MPAGLESVLTDPFATVSAWFGATFLPLSPMTDPRLAGERIDRHGAGVWLVKSVWSGGPCGVGRRMPIQITQALVGAIVGGSSDRVDMSRDSRFGFLIPRSVPGCPDEILQPRNGWNDGSHYDEWSARLALDTIANFVKFSEDPDSVQVAGPSTT